jgi:hypothetical protein
MSSTAAILIAARAQLAEATKQWNMHTERVEALRALADAELARCGSGLIAEAEAHWNEWHHGARSRTVQELMRIEAILHRRSIQAEIAAGRDPYAPDGLLCRPIEPSNTPESLLERELGRQWLYKKPNVLRLSAEVRDLERNLADARTEAGNHV